MGEWKKVKLGDVFDLQMGKTPDRKNLSFWNNGDNKWLSIADISSSGKYVNQTKETISDSAVIISGIKKVPKGTVLMSFKLSIGKVCIASENIYTNEAIMAFFNKENLEIDNIFLYYRLMSHNWTEGINKAVKGITLNKAVLNNTFLYFPSLSRQKEIAAILDKANELIALRKKQLAELDTLGKSVFYQMFGDPVKNEKGWKYTTLKDVCIKIYGGGTPSKNIKEYYENGDVAWVTPKDMKTKYILSSKISITKKAIQESSTKLIPIKSILMVIRSGILKHTLPLAINVKEITINQDMKAFVCNLNIISSEYLYSCLKAYESYLLNKVRSVTADNIEFEIIKSLSLPLPPLSLQNKFAEVIEKIEEEKELVRKALKESEDLFQRLMQDLFKPN